MKKFLPNNVLITLVKGFIIGASMLIPGVSGGTMAIILGIYDELIHAVSTLSKNFKENALLLVQFVAAALVGIILLSGPMLSAVTRYEKPMMFLFLGAILGSIPPLYRKVKVDRIKAVNIVVALLGAFIAVMTNYLPADMVRMGEGFNLANFIMLIVAGVIIAVALVLPGISASYILLMMGMYDMTLRAIKEMQYQFLIPLAIGVIAGTLLTAGVLERQMQRHPQFTYMLIIGFMLGSIVAVFPGVPKGLEILLCLVTFTVGFSVIRCIGKQKG